MIVFFSGTGNSRHIASQLAQGLGETPCEICRTDPTRLEFSGKSFGIILPVYAWGIPPLAGEWLRRLSPAFVSELISRGTYIWVILTCGDETGMAPEMLQDVLEERGLRPSAMWSVITPNVYVLLPGFDVDPQETQQKKLALMERRIGEIREAVSREKRVIDVFYGSFPKMKTRLVYPLFKRWGIRASKWLATEKCTGCGACVKACPMDNITLWRNRPTWGGNCVSCLGCYHRCPVNAVQYGSVTKHKGQCYFRFPKAESISLSSERKD
ncbi:MAG: EFR1 family ferrodoxin [Muribaculaceae bacterium]|nr:EFR1 family ferrodoxin [Muribaculaceae bacterium]